MSASRRSVVLEPAVKLPVRNARAQNPRKAGSTGLTKATEDSILSCALDAIWILDEDNRIEYLSPAAAALTGYTADELINQSIDIILPHGIEVTVSAGIAVLDSDAPIEESLRRALRSEELRV